MKKRFLSFILGITLCTACNSQENTSLSEEDLKELFKQEKLNEERAKFGGSKTEISIITDKETVDKIATEINLKINKRKQEELEKQKNKSLAERYKGGDKTVVPEIITILKGNDQEAKRKIYHGIDRDFDDPKEYTITEPELINVILTKVSNPKDEKLAIQLAGITNLPGYPEKFEKHLMSGKANDIGRLVFWLGKDGKSTKTLEYLKEKIVAKDIDLEKEDWIMSGLEGFAENGSEENKKTAVDLCFDIYKRKLISKSKFQELNKGWSSRNPAYGLSEIILNSNDVRTIAIAREFLKQGVREMNALNTLIRLEGEKHKDLLFKYLKNEEHYYDALSPSIRLYKLSQDEAIVKEILIQFESRNEIENYQIDRVVQALIEMGAEEYFNKLDQLVSKKNLVQRLLESYELSKRTIEDVAADFYSFGIVDKPVSKEIIERALAVDEGDESMGYVYDLLSASEVYLWFDAETGFVPVDYDKLITDLSKNSNGKFENITVWMDTYGDPGEEAIQYKITLLANNKAYVVEPEDIGDWYDVEMVLNLLNTAVKDAGLKERFIQLDTGDQTVQVMFGQEENIKSFVKKYKL